MGMTNFECCMGVTNFVMWGESDIFCMCRGKGVTNFLYVEGLQILYLSGGVQILYMSGGIGTNFCF